jgi:hypothetical protein
MASAELCRGVEKVVAYPPLCEVDHRQRREFQEACSTRTAPPGMTHLPVRETNPRLDQNVRRWRSFAGVTQRLIHSRAPLALAALRLEADPVTRREASTRRRPATRRA